LSINEDKYLLGIYFGGNSAKERNNKINFLMNKFRNKNASKNEESKKLTVKNENNSNSNYTVQTSSFKKISKSKIHINLLKNKIKILRSFEHQIKKNGRYFISYINVDDQFYIYKYFGLNNLNLINLFILIAIEISFFTWSYLSYKTNLSDWIVPKPQKVDIIPFLNIFIFYFFIIIYYSILT